MPIGSDLGIQYTEEMVGAGHPTKADTLNRKGNAEHHVDGKHRADLLPIGCGAYFEYVSSTQVRLIKAVGAGFNSGHAFYGDAVPFLDGSGNLYYLRLNGIVTKDNSGLAADTVYYAYAYDNSGAVALELSTTTWTSAELIPTKTGDKTRTLVGMLRTGGGTPTFNDDAANRRVKSFWNQVPKVAAHHGSGPSHSNTTWTSVLTVNLLAFNAENVVAFAFGRNRTSGTGTVSAHAITVDGVGIGGTTGFTPEAEDGEGVNVHTPIAIGTMRQLTAGYHTIEYISRVKSGAGTIDYGNPSLLVLYWG